jgi:uncharacterized Fe-S cluster-containing radical SAM superfamily protein
MKSAKYRVAIIDEDGEAFEQGIFDTWEDALNAKKDLMEKGFEHISVTYVKYDQKEKEKILDSMLNDLMDMPRQIDEVSQVNICDWLIRCGWRKAN